MQLSSRPLPDLLINADDYNRVLLLAERVVRSMPYVAAYLERELGRAELCHPWEPAGVSMGMEVEYRLDGEPGLSRSRLVWPGEARTDDDVSILSPLGAALIGMRHDSSIEWLDGAALRTLTVTSYRWPA